MLIYNAVRGCQGDGGVNSWADHIHCGLQFEQDLGTKRQ